MIYSIFVNGDMIQLIKNDSNGLKLSWYRSILFALSSSALCVIGGLLLAIQLSNISFYSKFGRILSLFMLPMTLGNVTIAYIFKIVLFNTPFFDSVVKCGAISQYSLLLFLQLWQYIFLFAYLFWISIHSIPGKLTTYSTVIKHTRYEYIKDIVLPNVKNLFILLFFIGFVFSFYENAKCSFILKASQGTKTELISQSLNRVYYSNLGVDPSFASLTAFKCGVIVFFTILIILFLLGVLSTAIINRIAKYRSVLKSVSHLSVKQPTILFSYVISLGCLLIILVPVLIALLNSQYHFSLDTLIEPVSAFFLTILAAVFAAILAVLFGISSKVLLKKYLKGFNTKSLGYLLVVFLLQLIPPLCIVLCAFKLLAVVGYEFDFLVYPIWILGHCFLTFPILGSFVLVTHFTVKESELDYLSVHKISPLGIINYSFIKRFRMEYILTLLFAFIFIWNDTSLNMILSDRIPSFAKNLEMLFTGKATNYSQATLYVFIALALAVASLSVWQYVINKVIKSKE